MKFVSLVIYKWFRTNKIIRNQNPIIFGGVFLSIMEKITTEEQYNQILKRLDEIFDAKRGTKEGEELERLVSLIEEYEKELLDGK